MDPTLAYPFESHHMSGMGTPSSILHAVCVWRLLVWPWTDISACLDAGTDRLALLGNIKIEPDCQSGSWDDKGGNTSKGRSAHLCQSAAFTTTRRTSCIHAAKVRPGRRDRDESCLVSGDQVYLKILVEALSSPGPLQVPWRLSEEHGATHLQHP